MLISRLAKLSVLALAISTAVMPFDADAQRNRESRPAAPVEQYPESTRESPRATVPQRLQRPLNAFIDKAQGDEPDPDVTLSEGQALADRENAAGYARALVYRLMADAAMEKDDYPAAIGYVQKAIDENGLGNNEHFNSMRLLAQLQAQEEQYDAALATLDRFITESASSNPDDRSLRAQLLLQADRPDEAIADLEALIASTPEPKEQWLGILLAAYADTEQNEKGAVIAERLLALNPTDKRRIFNAAGFYVQLEQYDRAAALLESARSQNLLTENGDYRQLYQLLAAIEGREDEMIAVIEEGLQRQILQPDSQVYLAIAQAYYFRDEPDVPKAIQNFQLAAPLASNGDVYVTLGQVLANEDRHAEAKAAIEQALARGTRREGAAWTALARAENGLGNREAAVAAMRRAMEFPETREAAERWLRSVRAL
jgi:predicted negative regulator of RcsB-dependent stress response